MGKKIDERRDSSDDSVNDDRKCKKNKSSKSRGKDQVDKRDNKGARNFIYSEGKPSNDPRWYLNNAALSRDVGSIWFSRPTGESIGTAYPGVPDVLNDLSKEDPGMMIFGSVLTWGGNNGSDNYHEYGNSALNVSAAKLYQYVVHANSRNTSYDAKSLMMSIMAVDGIYQVITEAIRAYRLVSMYSFENLYIGKLLKALGWDAAACKANVAQFRYYINLAISRVNKFFIPMLFDVVRAHQAAYENIFLDRPTTKGQILATKSCGVWEYKPEYGELAYTSKVWTNNDPAAVRHWNALKDPATFHYVVETLIDKVEGAQYMGVMQGDMLKAFGLGAMMQYNYVGIDEAIMPIYDEEFLFKIHNAEIPSIDTYMGCWYPRSSVFTDTMELFKYRDNKSVDGGIFVMCGGNMSPRSTGDEDVYTPHYMDLAADLPNTADTTLLMTLYKKFPTTPVITKWLNEEGESEDTFYVSDLNPEELMYVDVIVSPNFVYTELPDISWVLTPTEYQDTHVLHWGNGRARNGSTPAPNFTSGTSSSNNQWLPYHFALIGAISRFRKAPILMLPKGFDNASKAMMPGFMWDTDNYIDVPIETLSRCNYVIWWSLWASSVIANLS